jgi:hypothetical protein
MPHELLMRSVKLMGEEVLPALHEAKPPAGLGELAVGEAAASD